MANPKGVKQSICALKLNAERSRVRVQDDMLKNCKPPKQIASSHRSHKPPVHYPLFTVH